MRAACTCLVLTLVACSGSGPSGGATRSDATVPQVLPQSSQAPPEGEPSVDCEPYAVCGCEMGCVKVRREGGAPGATERYRVLEGTRADQILVRTIPGNPLHPDGAETCDESCRPGPATRHCLLTGETCSEQMTPEGS